MQRETRWSDISIEAIWLYCISVSYNLRKLDFFKTLKTERENLFVTLSKEKQTLSILNRTRSYTVSWLTVYKSLTIALMNEIIVVNS